MAQQDPGPQWPGQQQPGQNQWPGQQPWGQPGWPQQGHQPPWGPPPPGTGSPYGTPYPGAPYSGAPHGSPYNQPRYVAPPKPGIVPLRPLMFGEILDGSFQAIRRNAKAMLGAALLAQSLGAILAAVITAITKSSACSIEAWA